MKYLLTKSTTEIKNFGDNAIGFYSGSAAFTLFYDPRYFSYNFFNNKSYAYFVSNSIERLSNSVSTGYFSILHVKGIGFKVYHHSATNSLYFLLGYNHVTKIVLPINVSVKVRKQYILLFSNDSASLGKYDFLIRSLRVPDPYRGKGIRYRYQIMNFKPGKQRLHFFQLGQLHKSIYFRGYFYWFFSLFHQGSWVLPYLFCLQSFWR